MREYLIPDADLTIYDSGQQLVALPTELKDEILWVQSQLNCLVAGIQLAERKGTNLIPAHQLALSKLLNFDNIQKAEADLTTALQYLKREAIAIPESPPGYVLICYRNLALGWVKNMGNRSNNLYPQHWRIRMNV